MSNFFIRKFYELRLKIMDYRIEDLRGEEASINPLIYRD